MTDKTDDDFKDVAYLLDDTYACEEDDDEAFSTIVAMIKVQPDRAAEFRGGLKTIVQRHDEEECRTLVEENANRYVDDGADAYEWLSDLHKRVESAWEAEGSSPG